jgi:hypothetical protein
VKMTVTASRHLGDNNADDKDSIALHLETMVQGGLAAGGLTWRKLSSGRKREIDSNTSATSALLNPHSRHKLRLQKTVSRLVALRNDVGRYI